MVFRLVSPPCLATPLRLRSLENRETGSEDDPILDEELSKVLQEAIAQLPEGYREVFVLRDMEGMSNDEVGKVAGLTVAAVKSRLHRSRMFLRNKLSNYLQDKV